MNGILAKSSENKLHGVISPKNPEAVETAGSLAMNIFQGLFSSNTYDEFSTNNPFSVDYSMYSSFDDYTADNGFLSNFSNAVSVIGFDGGVCSPSTDCGSPSGSSGGSSSGFASFC